ncbi:MAG: glycosyltransferase [Patescibacteria group bacterium]|nr:glycosyltransferase [Patescibacteria group bacterium]
MKIEEKQKKLCTVIIPALNEELTIKNCVTTFKKHPLVKKVIVVANACNDKTAIIARNAGATVVQTKTAGKGFAIMSGIKKSDTEIIILCDGDLKNPSKKIIDKLLCGYSSDIALVKGRFNRDKHHGPITDILIKPILQSFNHPAKKLQQPLSGMIAVEASFIKSLKLPKDFGIDLFIVLMAFKQNKKVVEVEIPNIKHRQRDWSHYEIMAKEVLNVLKFFGLKFEK